MKKVQKKKICWYCESQVPLEIEICPVCGVSVAAAHLDGGGAEFSPPYSSDGTDFGIPKPPYEVDFESAQDSSGNTESAKEVVENQPAIDEFKRVLMTMVLLLTGSVLFLFSLALALFSHRGVFTLQWDGSYWYIYTLIALPLMIVGSRVLMKLDQENSP